MKVRNRNSAFEFLRLVAMFMILLEHCLLATEKNIESVPLSTIDNVFWFIEAFTICAVNLFFLLTGYFLEEGKLKIGRIVLLWIKTILYSSTIYFVMLFIKKEPLEIKTLMGYVTPILSGKYWFIQTYIALSLLSPFFASLLSQLSKKRHLLLIGILLLFFCIHPTFIPVSKTLDATQGYGIIWGSVLLVVGKFLCKYGKEYLGKVKSAFFLLGYGIVACGIFVSNIIIIKFDVAQGIASRGNFYAYNSISVFLEAVCLFCFFIKISECNINCKYINYFAESSVAVYLITSHPLMLYYLWTNLINIGRYGSVPLTYIVLALLFSFMIFSACIGIDKIVDWLLRVGGIERISAKLNRGKLNCLLNGENR